MATTFPTSLDILPNPTSTTVLDAPGLRHSDQHINANDAIEAIEAKVGIDLSSVQNSLDYITKLFLLTQTQHQRGTYREITYSIACPVAPAVITWYTDPGKTIRLVDKVYTYGGSVKILPTVITLRLYNGTVANSIVRTVTDTITYNKVFEVSRNRVVV